LLRTKLRRLLSGKIGLMATSPRAFAAPALDAATLERVLTFLRRMLARTADELGPIDAGWVALTPSLPAVWGLNTMIVRAPLSFEALLALADEQLHELNYRQLAVENQDTGPALEGLFRAGGWKVDREVLMVLSTGPDRAADTSLVIEADESSVLELMRRWHAEGRDLGDEELRQLVEYSRREARACGDRLLGVRSGDGQLVAISKLRCDGRTAQVEDVYTVPEARGRGYARALVSHAAALARQGGHDLVFITADDYDWPRLLYGRIGFRALGRRWLFHRS
jgi:GNAT superfamily N-acetyltransferase